jgi:hypothetical protein
MTTMHLPVSRAAACKIRQPADNENFTWTLLNSWGFGKDANNTRDKGLTADGLFKARHGMRATAMCIPQTEGVMFQWQGMRSRINGNAGANLALRDSTQHCAQGAILLLRNCRQCSRQNDLTELRLACSLMTQLQLMVWLQCHSCMHHWALVLPLLPLLLSPPTPAFADVATVATAAAADAIVAAAAAAEQIQMGLAGKGSLLAAPTCSFIRTCCSIMALAWHYISEQQMHVFLTTTFICKQ